MSDFGGHARNQLQTAAGTYIRAVSGLKDLRIQFPNLCKVSGFRYDLALCCYLITALDQCFALLSQSGFISAPQPGASVTVA